MGLATKEYNSLDILKLILAVFVLVIHSGIDKTVISPLLRIAVPIFFIISGYLFFSKVERLTKEKEKRSALWHLVKRNILLYLFWTAVQLPLFIYGNHYHIDFFKKGVFYTLRDIVTGSGFTGAWYIVALALGTVIIYYASKKLSSGWLLLLTLPLYIMCCFTTNYRGLFGDTSWIVDFSDGYKSITNCDFNTSLPGGLFWIALGNYLAKRKPDFKQVTPGALLVASAVLIVIERWLIVKFKLDYLDDCYFALAILCPAIFVLVKNCNFTFKSWFKVREMSTLIYVVHGSCGRIVGFVLKKMPDGFLQSGILKICLTLLIATVIGLVFLLLRDKFSKIKALKYAC